ncbi:MAG TPA: hypothetical protein VHB98_20155 [Chloroflexota bacterium]|jgi:hypothetical protein|nr:hypothetical protein [Chloroflexota bacterium]
MQEMRWCEEANNPAWADDGPALTEELRRAVRGEVALAEAMLTLASFQEEQERAAVALLERETWALTAILERSTPIWRYLPTTTLRFALDHPNAPHLELGLFSHLATLVAPRAGEQALMAATTPRWARVYTHHQQQPAGQAEALVRTYVPISVTEAVATLGLGRILTQIEVATRTAGRALEAQAHAQRERQAQLWRAERMLGCAPEPAAALPDRTRALPTRLLLLLLGPAALLAAGGALWGFAVVLVSSFFGLPEAVLALLLGAVGLLIWISCHTTSIPVDPRQ